MVEPRFQTLAILKLVVKQAIDGDVEALRWLEDHGFLTFHQEEGRIWLSWNQEAHDSIFFEEEYPDTAPGVDEEDEEEDQS
ncbi:MAG: hypothetical protein OXF39_05840 [Nitrospira sp.]|nr:hypothetical protein [Nitrospira sp.]